MLIELNDNGTTTDGKWKLVPVEPTEGMLIAAAKVDWYSEEDPTWKGLYQVMLSAAPEAPQPAAVPDGYKLVPVEPTEEMLTAWQKHFGTIQGAYKAMLSAAPETQQAQDKDAEQELAEFKAQEPSERIAKLAFDSVYLGRTPEAPQAQDKDGERYRWLKAAHNSMTTEWHVRNKLDHIPNDIDAAIDAAMKESRNDQP